MTTFPTVPQQNGIKRTLIANVKMRRREDLALERIWVSAHIQHAFEIPWGTLRSAERAELDDFFAAVRGRKVRDIAYTDPWDSVGYTCRLDADSLAQIMHKGDSEDWGATLRLLEVANFKALKPAVADFPLQGNRIFQAGYEITRRYSTVIERHDDDTEQSYEDYALGSGGADGILEWRIGGDVLTDDDADAILDCYEGNGGPYLAMSYSDPETATDYTVHFADVKLEHLLVHAGCSAIRVRIEELKGEGE